MSGLRRCRSAVLSWILPLLLVISLADMVRAQGDPGRGRGLEASEGTGSSSQVSELLAKLAAERQKRIEVERELAEMRELVARVLDENRSLRETVFSPKDVVAEKRAKFSDASPLSTVLKPASAGSAPAAQVGEQSWPSAPRGLDLVPSNPTGRPGTTAGLPQGSSIVPLSSEMFRDFLPLFPNFDVGFLYEFGDSGVRNTFFFSDLLVPISAGAKSAGFADLHFGYHGYPTRKGTTTVPTQFGLSAVNINYETERYASHRINLSVGGGYRTILGDRTMLGVNAYYDAPRIFGTWFGTWGWGIEVASLIGGGGLADLTFNSYGNPASIYGTAELWKEGVFSYDVEIGYSQPLLNGELDLRVKGIGYQWTAGTLTKIYGYRGGMELGSGNGLVRAAIDYGYDGARGRYGTVMAYLNLGFQAERILRGESPFTLPEPVFNSPSRNLRRLLTHRVHRNRNISGQVVSTTGIAIASGSPVLIATLNPPLRSFASGSFSNGSFTQAQVSNSTVIVSITDNGNGNGPRWSGYNLRLGGDTSSLSFPITVNITGIPVVPPLVYLRVDAGAVDTTTRQFVSPGQVITIGGSTPDNNLRPMLYGLKDGEFDSAPPGFVFGRIEITAPGTSIPMLTVFFVKG